MTLKYSVFIRNLPNNVTENEIISKLGDEGNFLNGVKVSIIIFNDLR